MRNVFEASVSIGISYYDDDEGDIGVVECKWDIWWHDFWCETDGEEDDDDENHVDDDGSCNDRFIYDILYLVTCHYSII